MDFKFGEWLPDLPEYNNPGLITAKNVLPGADSYLPFPSLATYSASLTSRAKGAISVRDVDGNAYNYVGTAGGIYEISNTSWTDVTNVSASYSTADDDVWEFAQWKTQLIATNFGDVIQSISIGSANFSDLSGSPPQARHIAVVRNFIMAGNTYDSSDGNQPTRIRWCGFDDETTWTVSSATQADYEDLSGEGGWVQRVVGGEYATIFQETAITRATYVGTPTVFQIDQLETKNGTPAPGSVVKFGSNIAYLGQDGFYVFDGLKSIPIGANKIDKYFYSDIDQTYFNRIFSVVDPINKLIFWAYPGSGNTGGRANRMLVYNFATSSTKRWSVAEIETETIFRSLGEGYTLDSLDNISSSIDDLLFSLDSRIWTGSSIVLSAFNSTNQMSNFTGDPLTAVMESGDFELTKGKRSQVNNVRPLIEGTSASVSVKIGLKETLTDTVSYTSAANPETTGDTYFRAQGRYHRVYVEVVDNFDFANGVDIPEIVDVGTR